MIKEEKILLIVQLAIQITQAGIAHVHVRFSPHVSEWHITIEPTDTNYQNTARKLGVLFKDEFYVGKNEHLNDDSTNTHLDRAIQKLEDLKSKEATC